MLMLMCLPDFEDCVSKLAYEIPIDGVLIQHVDVLQNRIDFE